MLSGANILAGWCDEATCLSTIRDVRERFGEVIHMHVIDVTVIHARTPYRAVFQVTRSTRILRWRGRSVKRFEMERAKFRFSSAAPPTSASSRATCSTLSQVERPTWHSQVSHRNYTGRLRRPACTKPSTGVCSVTSKKITFSQLIGTRYKM